MSVQLTNFFIRSLLPCLDKGKLTEKDKREACGFLILMGRVFVRSLNAFNERRYEAFDAHVGDGGCQIQAIHLRRISCLQLEEAKGVAQTAAHLEMTVQEWLRNPKKFKEISKEKIIQEAEEIPMSKEMEYLFHCYLLNFARVPHKVHQNGRVENRIDSNKLRKLSKTLTDVQGLSIRLQRNLSFLNAHAIREEAEQLGERGGFTCCTQGQKELLVRMLSEKQLHCYSPDPTKYPEKAICSLFHSCQTVLFRLREDEALIMIKSLGVSKSFPILMKPSESGGPFKVLRDLECKQLTFDEAIVVFEASLQKTQAEVIGEIETFGFTNLVLASTAKEAPYESGTDVLSIQIEAARGEMQKFQEFSSSIEMTHVFLSTVGRMGIHETT